MRRATRGIRPRQDRGAVPGIRRKKRKIVKSRRNVQPAPSAFPGGYELWVDNGIYKGGEQILEAMLPEDAIFPEVPVDVFIAAGLEAMRSGLYPLIPTAELGEQIINALDLRQPLSVVRLGDGELLTLAQGAVLSVGEVQRRGPFLSYAGVRVPDFAARDQLLQAVRGASVIGIPRSRHYNFQPLAFSVFRAYGIDFKSLRLTDSLINYRLYESGYLSKLLYGRRVLTVGNKAAPLAKVLAANGVHIAGAVAPVKGMGDVPRVLRSIREKDFDLALVSAGIPAVMITEKIASELGKVAIDFGHLADSLVAGETFLF